MGNIEILLFLQNSGVTFQFRRRVARYTTKVLLHKGEYNVSGVIGTIVEWSRFYGMGAK